MKWHPGQERFFKFDHTGPVEISHEESGYSFLSDVKSGVTRVEYVDTPLRYIVHVNSQASSWEWDRLTEILNADQLSDA